MKKKWYRSRKDKMIGGVCGGIGEYFDVDPTIIRIIAVIGLFAGAGVLAYIVLWIVVPEEPYVAESTTQKTETTEENTDATGTTAETGPDNQSAAEQPVQQKRNRSGIFGGILVILGALLLVDNFVTFHAFWPLLLILLGVGILLKTRYD